MSKSNLVGKCFVIVTITNVHVEPIPRIYLDEPTPSKNPHEMIASFDTVFEAKNYIKAFNANAVIKVA